MTEQQILTVVRDYLRARGWFVIRIQQGLGCMKGISDLIAVGPAPVSSTKHLRVYEAKPRVVFLEIKTAKGKQSDYQVAFQQAVEEHGGIYKLVRGMDDILGWA